MYFAAALVPFIGLLVADFAVATPTPVVGGRIPHKRSCASPADTTVDPSGQFIVHYSDNVIRVGDSKPADMMAQVGSQCASSGSCNPNPWTAKSGVKADPEGTDLVDVTMTASGLYPVWVHNGLAEALMLAVQQATNMTTDTYTPTTVCSISIGCSGQLDKEINVYSIPEWIAVYWYNPNDCDADPAYMGIQTSIEQPRSSGFCSTFATLGNSLATLMDSNPGATVFGLFGLACSAAGE